MQNVEYSEFLDKVHERIVDRAAKKHLTGILRLGNVWRCNNAEATIMKDPSRDDLLIMFRCGPDASRYGQHNVGSVDETADLIVDGMEKRQRRLP